MCRHETLHIFELELNFLKQKNINLIDYYNTINYQLTLMINKTIMTYGDNSEITKEHNKRHCADALIVFIIELTNNILII